MKIKHKDYLIYEIPNNWEIEETEKTTSIFKNNGDGALTLSFYTIMEIENTLEEHIRIMAKDFIDRNKIKLDNSLILYGTKKDKMIIYGTGKTKDAWFIKLWIISKYPKIILASYNSENKTSELNQIDKIINSFQFKNLD